MRKILLCVLLCFILCGCTAKEYTDTLFAMDTVTDLKIYAESAKPLNAAKAEIERIDALLDRGDENSEIYKINAEKSAVLSDETAELLRFAIKISEETHGAFDITTAPVSDLWGFYGGDFNVPSDEDIRTALDGVGYEKIKISGNTVSLPENTSIDLGGIGKGYASNRAVSVLKENGVTSGIISLGGNVYAIGSRPDKSDWVVGIADPANKTETIGKVNVNDKAVVTSGGYQRFFEENGVTYHHIIDPKTGKSARSGLSSVTVISESGTLADGLSTALFVAGLDGAAEIWRENGGFDAVLIDENGKIYVTDGIVAAFESEKNYEVITE